MKDNKLVGVIDIRNVLSDFLYSFGGHIRYSVLPEERRKGYAKEIGKENGIPYEDDLYLDVIVTPKGEIILLDEDELKEALDRRELTKEEYENAYKEAEKLMHILKDKKEELKEFTDKYFEIMIKDNMNLN